MAICSGMNIGTIRVKAVFSLVALCVSLCASFGTTAPLTFMLWHPASRFGARISGSRKDDNDKGMGGSISVLLQLLQKS
jgi:hypothetical protein